MATEKSKGKIVWIFGAGASRGAGAFSSIHGGKTPIPMQSLRDFYLDILRVTRKLLQKFTHPRDEQTSLTSVLRKAGDMLQSSLVFLISFGVCDKSWQIAKATLTLGA